LRRKRLQEGKEDSTSKNGALDYSVSHCIEYSMANLSLWSNRRLTGSYQLGNLGTGRTRQYP
jgi:hypothetical protein